MVAHTVTLAGLGIRDDPGTSWHPSRRSAYDGEGLLLDLDDEQAAAHLAKPEFADERDAGPLAAEDSAETAGDVI